MPSTGRSRFVVPTAGLAGVALVVALAIGIQPKGGGPRLDAPGGGSLPVTPAQSANGPVEVSPGHFVGADQKHDRSAALRDVKPLPLKAPPERDEDAGDHVASSHVSAADTVVQSAPAAPAMPATTTSFNGIGFPGVNCNCAPPDTNGEAGATQYVQIVNEGFQVFDKATGASVYGPAGIATIWSNFGGLCQTSGFGDPVVLYDQVAGRWLISQFAGSSVPTDECVAVSTSSDATGAWNRYDFHLGSNFFDYPHLAVWTDGYYMSMNVFNSAGTAFLGPQPFAFDRAAMLAGQAATFVTPGIQGSQPYLPADLDGSTLPPTGAAESFVAWPGDGTYRTYHYKPNFTTPANSSWTTFAAPAAAGFTELCPTTRACVPQSGQTSSSNLDGIGDRLMFRLAYRNFGDHESVVGNFSVNSGGVAGIRWFELRNVTSGAETVYQESTYQPDTTWRWMGSAAMDQNGDIALGFSASSSSIFPQLRYAGRLAGDPLNTLGQGEATLFAGTGSQNGTGNRWGDYSDLTVDPVDDCTFWFTSEYYATTGQFNWKTRIGSFRFSGCGSPPPAPGSMSGTVTDASTHTAIAGATVSISGGPSTTTDGAGAYSFSSLSPATYSVTASKSGYASSSASVTVSSGSNSVQDFALAPIRTTGWFYVASSVPGTGGDGNGYETNRPYLVGAPDGLLASDVNSGTGKSTSCASPKRDSEVATFAISGVSGSIMGIRVQLTGRASSTLSSPRFCVQLSWNGGVTWTAGKSTGNLTTTLATYTLGSTSDTWGHGWSSAELGGSSFRVRIIDLASSTSRTFYLDSIGVAVTYY